MDKLIIYYINLEKDTIRNSKIKIVLDNLHIKYKRIEGINGNDINIEKKYTVVNTDKWPMTKGQYGCYLSHIKCYEEFIKSEYEYLIILEDDAILYDNFKNSITKLFDSYNKLLKNTDFIYLSRSDAVVFENKYSVNTEYYNDEFIYSPIQCGYGFYSYFLIKEGAKKLLEIINKAKIQYDTYNIFVPIDVLDTWHNFGKNNKILLNIYALKEQISEHDYNYESNTNTNSIV